MDYTQCKHKKLIRGKDLLWKCTVCESYFTVKIQQDDTNYVWLQSPIFKEDFEKFNQKPIF